MVEYEPYYVLKRRGQKLAIFEATLLMDDPPP